MIRQRTSHKKVVQRSCLFYGRLDLQCASNVFCHQQDSLTRNTKIENARIFVFSGPLRRSHFYITGLQQTIALNFAKKVIVNLFMELKANVI